MIDTALEFLKVWLLLSACATVGAVALIRLKAPRDLDKELRPVDQVVDLTGRRW